MKHQKLNLKAVSPEDFDAKSLRRAAREGRLFIALPDIEPKSAEDAIDEILSYVGRISHKELCRCMEGATQCRKHYSGMGPYLLDVDQMGLVREILDKNRE